MQKKLRAAVCLATGLGVLSVSSMGGDLISPASAKSTAEAQDKVVKHQTLSSHTIKAVPGSPDGVLLMQAQALIGKLPATMPGSEHDTPTMVSLGEKLYFERGLSINNTQSCNSCHPIDNKGSGADNRKTGTPSEFVDSLSKAKQLV